MFEILKDEKVDYIVHCGDLAHTKTQLSPEYFDMAQWFLKSLADIAPLYILPGNHDGNLKNSSRQDAITPIVEALAHPDLHFIKKSEEVLLDDNFAFNVLSVFDEENWQDPSDYERVNIALHHGSINGCKTDQNWVMEYGDNDIAIFKNFDYVFLGDIHKTNQTLDDDGRVRYCGSTVQQNHGETNDKGFLIWEIEDKEQFTCKHISVPNPKPFITLELTPKGKLPRKADVPESARLRIVANNNLPLNVLKKAVDVAKTKFNPESVTFLNRAAGQRGSVDNLTGDLAQEDLRDMAVQEKFIQEYLKDYEVSDDIMVRILDLNRKFNTIVEEGEDVIRNVNWRIDSVEWDNLFNYGEGNKVIFKNLEGIVGIFGKNYSGKSSVVDSLLYTLFDKTSKNNRKNLHVINQNKDFCRGSVNISVGDKVYNVERSSEKYMRTLKGQTTQEAKTNVEFTAKNNVLGEEEELNGLSRQDTDKRIRKVFGTSEDFLLTSMASQLDSLAFIKEGSVKRKEILAKFLDLEIFDKKYKLAKEESSELRVAIKRLEEKDFVADLDSVEEEIKNSVSETRKQKRQCTKIKKSIEKLHDNLSEVDIKIGSIPAEVIDYEGVKTELESKQRRVQELIQANRESENEIRQHKEYLEKVENLKSVFDIEEFRNKQSIITEHKKQINTLVRERDFKKRKLGDLNNRIKLLDEVPCGSEFSHCKFIKDAYEANKDVDIIEEAIRRINQAREHFDDEIEKLEPQKVEEYIDKYEDIEKKGSETSSTISDLSLNIEKGNNNIITLQLDIDKLSTKLFEYESNREFIENLEHLLKEKADLNSNIDSKNEELEKCEQDLLAVHKVHGSLEQKLQNLHDQKEELTTLRKDYAAYDLYEKCMRSKDGIPYDIIKNKLPVINEEVSKILSNIVDFEVFFETSDKKLEINIKHARFEPRPIELGSGAEKTISAMAIRLALLSVSNLPKPDLFILDEPGTALDEDNMEGFIRILTDMIKTQFKTVLLISHLDSLKDCVDTTIEIEKMDGLAYVNQ